MPIYLLINKFEKFSSPVNIANIEDSTFWGINFANKTIAGRVVYALYSVSVTDDVRHTKVRGDKPNVIYLVYKTVVNEPIIFIIHAVIIIFLISRSLNKPL